MKKGILKILKLACIFAAILTSGYAFSADHVSASEPPASFTTTDGLLNDQGVDMQFWFDFTRTGYDRSTGKVTYNVTSRYYFSAHAWLSTDELYVNGNYIGSFSSHNGEVYYGYGSRSESFTVTLYEGDNTVKTTGIDGTGGNTAKTVHIPKFREYTVTFVDHDGTQLKKQTVESSDSDYCATAPSNPERSGYHFTGWNRGYCNITSNITVTAKYDPNVYTVKYNGNGSTSGSMSSSSHTYDTAKKLNDNKFAKTGYQYAGWNTKTDGSGTSYSDEQSVKNLTGTNGGVVNLYAKWTPNTYTVKYNGNGSTTGSMSSSSHTYDTAKKLNDNKFAKTGYHFTGWNTKADGSDTSYSDEQSVKNLTGVNGGMINLYAQWSPNTYTVYYNGNGYSSGSMSNSDHTYDTARKLNANGYSRTGYKFIEWRTNANGTGTKYADQQSVKNLTSVNDGSVTLYAKWDKAPSITAGNQSFYENEITAEQWKNLRMKDVSAADQEDGSLTAKIKITLDNVNVTKPGIYEITYEVTDSVDQTVTKTVTITIKKNDPPIINAENKTFYENEYSQEEWESNLRMEDVIATDTEDGDITSKIKVTYDDVEVDKVGAHKVVYEVIDAFGKKAEKAITVTILYNNPPIIHADSKIFHENELTTEEWKKEVWKDVSAEDEEDGALSDQIKIIKDDVDPTTPGAYEVIFEVRDSLGKTTQKAIDVTVLENWEPVLQIFASSKRLIEGQYSDDEWQNEIRMIGVSAHDREDADLTDQIMIKNDSTIPSKHGQYEVTYKVTDRWGKTAEKTVRVIVEPNEAPEIFANDKNFDVTDPINTGELLKNVTAVDDRDGDISENVVIIYTDVMEGKPGTYQVSYEVSDSLGKKTQKTIKVYIGEEAPTPPTPPLPDDKEIWTIWNGRQLAQLSLTKEMEKSLFDDNAYQHVVFGIYAAEDIIYKGEVVLPKDSMIGISHIDENGNINVRIYHEGKYYVQELSTNENYQLDTNKYYFEFIYEQTGGK